MENSDVQLVKDVEEKIVNQVGAPLYSARNWIKFVGIMLIIQGVFYALTIVGILVAWLPIWLGITLTGASNRIAIAYETKNKYSLIEAQTKLGSFFIILGVLMLIGLVLAGLFFFIALSSGFLVEYITHMEQSF